MPVGNYSITVEGILLLFSSLYLSSRLPGDRIPSLTVLANSKAPEDILPITASCWTNLGQNTLSLSGPEPGKLVLYSQVTEGLSPVLGAETEALVTSDDSQTVKMTVKVTLKDDGVAPDNMKNDGIYSGYFTEFQVNPEESRHQVTCKVRGEDTTRVLNVTAANRAFPSRPSSTTPICCGSSGVPPDTPLSPTGTFTRSKSGGAVKFGPVDQTVSYPPGPVRDLTVDNISSQNSTFSLSFTSPGANLDKGQIKAYTIYYSNNKTMLDQLDTTSNRSLPFITTEDCDCDLHPQPPTSKVHLTLRMETFSTGEQTFFRVLLLNDADKISLSNTKGIFLPNFFIPSYPLGLTWGIAVAIFLGSMGGTFLVFGAVFWHKWYYKW